MFDLLLLTGVAGSFLVNLPGRMDGDELFVRYFLALVLILSFFFAPKRTVRMGTLGVFLLVALASVFLNFHTPQRGVFPELLLGVLAVKAIAERENIEAHTLGKCLAAFWTLFNGLLLYQKMGWVYPGYELSGPFQMPWIMGSAACLSIPFIVAYRRILVLLLAPALLLSHSTACAVVAILLFLNPQRLSIKPILVVIGLSIAYALVFDFSFESTRFVVWAKSLGFMNNWFIGNGIGSWAHMGFIKANGADYYHWQHAHNLYLQTFFETGLLGLLALGAVLWRLWVMSYGAVRNALLGLLMLNFVHPVAHIPRFSVFLVILAAMILRNDGLITQKGA